MANETRLTVVRGRPDEAELAAVTAVLLARLRGARGPDAEPPPPPPRAGWGPGSDRFRPPVTWSARA
ncbi:acyl-CoA carboxylase epsilon subunit [Streptomyces xinghaiensis]|uniref:acyl-CoA carboxylase epsilon subunit n=1 Tax=Streptomyces xinghaiensis TaxID=1038928 RepID=UPI000BAFDD93|nr:acyl-CoA carboxylase epsilon subunit [Streptomyces xinghaiensis]